MKYTVARGDAFVVEIYWGNNTKFSNENYEIYRPGEEAPFQVGRTNADGRVIFVPDSSGTWRLRAFSDDGHGVDISLEVGENNILIEPGKPAFERYSRFIFGVAVIFGLFGMFSLFYRKRRS
ncbi:MAG: hypothetical protein GTO51_05485 [Candidatus Latescibacteria bacterium]|nr:hypothetical protein [Candidatus Latescibacterota bacterium]